MILRKYGTIKGKLSQKISAIVEEHKFFTENKVCPTCEQDIEESFHVNKLETLKISKRNYRKGSKNSNWQSKKKNKESNHKSISLEVTSLLNENISKNHLKSLHVRNKSEILNLKFKQLTTDQKIEILNMTS